jgi:tol-pal system protein YbgF
MGEEPAGALRVEMIRRGPLTYFSASALFAAAIAGTGCAPGGYYHTSQGALDSLLMVQGKMDRRVDAIEGKLEATREGGQTTRATTDARLRETNQRLDAIDGKIDALSARLTQLIQKVDALRYKVGAAGTGAGESAPSGGSGGRDSIGAAGTMDPEAMYQAAYSDISAGRYELARQAFQTYLKHFPDTEVADNAQYWIGESYYATGDFQSAITEFQKVVDNYPKADKAPASLLKIGLAYSRLKKPEAANRAYRVLIQKYPKSPEAAAAKERLAARQ